MTVSACLPMGEPSMSKLSEAKITSAALTLRRVGKGDYGEGLGEPLRLDQVVR